MELNSTLTLSTDEIKTIILLWMNKNHPDLKIKRMDFTIGIEYADRHDEYGHPALKNATIYIQEEKL